VREARAAMGTRSQLGTDLLAPVVFIRHRR
jgi:hypothetical protein